MENNLLTNEVAMNYTPAIVQNPQEILDRGREAAQVLKSMIDQTNSKVKIGNSEHIKIEAWQTIGSFYHTTVKTRLVEACTIAGIDGAHAIADLVTDDGLVIGSGESYCMRDEANWKTKPWFQLSSMAQTRAASKALSNKYKWVCVLAGYAGTPAEEMDSEATPAHPAMATTNTKPSLSQEIQEHLNRACKGDIFEMETMLKMSTLYQKEGVDKWVKLSDLSNIESKNEKWIYRIHQNVLKIPIPK